MSLLVQVGAAVLTVCGTVTLFISLFERGEERFRSQVFGYLVLIYALLLWRG